MMFTRILILNLILFGLIACRKEMPQEIREYQNFEDLFYLNSVITKCEERFFFHDKGDLSLALVTNLNEVKRGHRVELGFAAPPGGGDSNKMKIALEEFCVEQGFEFDLEFGVWDRPSTPRRH